MGTAGNTVLRKGGRRGILPGGSQAVLNKDGDCPTCCGCTAKTLGSTVTNSGNPIWNLNGFHGAGKAHKGSFWRLIEMADCYPHSYPWYGAGCVDDQGQLTGLQQQFQSGYNYDGHMELQIGCVSKDGQSINWPGNCWPQTPRSDFPC